MSDIITVNDLNLWYGPTQALHHVTISVPEHSITALIGPSGCGKSTFLKTLDRMNDLIPGVKVEGQVLYKGQDIYAPGVDVSQLRREVGMVFQKPNPFPMSIYDNVAYGPRTHGIRNKAKLDELVEQSLRRAAIWDEVKDRLKKNALGLSGGQQQRLCIARALAVEPDVLLMDELGPAESGAKKFCEAVLAALDGDLPVLGVLQKADTEFLRAVAGHPRVRLVTVTVENRDELRRTMTL